MSQDNEDLIWQAKQVLDFNWSGKYTRPGPRLYPHQWSWDSALIAIGYAHYAQRRAIKELSHLFESQWENGLLPQIVFDPHFGLYFPGISFWHAERSPHTLPLTAKPPAWCSRPSMLPPYLESTDTPRTLRARRDSSSTPIRT
jgi:Mannosylglycerate hydrolase MGH1-like glycoside hydrolase domain